MAPKYTPLVYPLDLEKLINDTLRPTHPKYQIAWLPALQSAYKISEENVLTITIDAVPKYCKVYTMRLNIAETNKPSAHNVQLDFYSRQPLKKVALRNREHKSLATLKPKFLFCDSIIGLYHYKANIAYANIQDAYLLLPQLSDTFFIKAIDFHQPIYLLQNKAKPISEQEAYLLEQYFALFMDKETQIEKLNRNAEVEYDRLYHRIDILKGDTFLLGRKTRMLEAMLDDCKAGRPIQAPWQLRPIPSEPAKYREVFGEIYERFTQDFSPNPVGAYDGMNSYLIDLHIKILKQTGAKPKNTNRIVLLVELEQLKGDNFIPVIKEVHAPEELAPITAMIKEHIFQTKWGRLILHLLQLLLS